VPSCGVPGDGRRRPLRASRSRSGSASVATRPLELSRKEFDLLHLLMANAGAVLTRERLIEEVWDTTWFGTTKTLDVHVSSLRKKLGDDPSLPRYVHTARGVGFRFAAPDEIAGRAPA
jgi:DNA-binding response OmpR family regulator